MVPAAMPAYSRRKPRAKRGTGSWIARRWSEPFRPRRRSFSRAFELMITGEFVQALLSARRRMTVEAWRQLAAKLATMPLAPDASSIHEVLIGQQSQDGAWLLVEAFRKNAAVSWTAIAAAMSPSP